jgi:membrane fusion protein (multidrug efflux system)
VRYFSPQFLPEPPVDGGWIASLVNRRNVIAIAVGIGALLVVAWFLFGSDTKAPAPAGAQGGRPGGVREVAVATMNPVLKAFAHEVEALGTLRANESVDITAKMSDRVAAIRFKEGQQVRAGEVLVELDSVEERADLAGAEAALADSRSQYNRSRELFETRALSEAQLDQLQATLSTNEARVAAARSRLNDTIIVAPFSGRVGLRNVSLGSLVNPGAAITTLDDLSVMKLDFSVPEVFLSTLKQGQEVGARSSAYAGETFRGRVGSIDTRVDPVTRSVAVRAIIDNRDNRLRPGMFMTVTLTRSEGKALMLPEEAIVPEDNQHFVFLVQDGRAAKKVVEIGRRRPGEVEILSGLTPEDAVVVDGTVNLRDGMPVRLIERAANPQPGAESAS